jgi:hypothetical protein
MYKEDVHRASRYILDKGAGIKSLMLIRQAEGIRSIIEPQLQLVLD